MEAWLLDLRYALRRLRQGRGFTLAAIGTIALGIGVAGATFSVAEASLLRPLPFPSPDRLVRIREVTPQGEPFPLSEPDFLDYSHAIESLSTTAAMKPAGMTLTGRGEPRHVDAAAVSASIFGVLGLRTAAGRVFGAADDTAGEPARVAVLGHALWRQQFGADPAAVGSTIQLDGASFQVVGVLAEGAAFPQADLMVPLGASPAADRTDHWLEVIGRLAPGATIGDARAQAAAAAARFGGEHPSMHGWSAQVTPISDWFVGPVVRRVIWIVLGAVAILMALACANLAGLLTARAVARRGEMGVRAALGAARGRIVRQLLAESLLLASAGGALGLALTAWTLRTLSAYVTDLLPPGSRIVVDAPVLALVGVLVVVLTIGFGLLPALHAAGQDVSSALRPSNLRSTAAGRRWIAVLVAVQVALAMVLTVATALLGGSFLRLTNVDPGFEPEHVLTVPLTLDDRTYPELARRTFFTTVVSRLSSLSGVNGAAATTTNPFREFGYANDVTPEERAATAPASGFMVAGWRAVTPAFFSTMKVPVLEGRPFTEADRADAPGVVVISRSLASRLWPGVDPIGRRLYWGGTTGRTRTVVGIVGDIRDVRLDAAPTPTLYLAYDQLPLNAMTIVVRTDGKTAGMAAAVRREIRALAPSLPIPDVRPLMTNRDALVAAPRFRAMVLAVFGAAALLMAAVGLYAIVAFSVAQRTREIAIRVAIGARPSQVTGMFVRSGLLLTVAGATAGLLGAWALAGVLRSVLFDTSARDPWLFAAAAVSVAVVAPLASYLPARRAARLDPLVALTREQL